MQKRSERDGVPYRVWAEEGFLTPTPGNVTDFDYIEEQIRALCNDFDVREVAFDPNFARQTMFRLLEDGLPVVECRQAPLTMSPMISETERLILGRKLIHGGNPVLRWAIGNVNVDTNKYGSKRFAKARSKEKIDPAVAMVMAVGRASMAEDNRSVYADSSISDDELIDLMVW